MKIWDNMTSEEKKKELVFTKNEFKKQNISEEFKKTICDEIDKNIKKL